MFIDSALVPRPIRWLHARTPPNEPRKLAGGAAEGQGSRKAGRERWKEHSLEKKEKAESRNPIWGVINFLAIPDQAFLFLELSVLPVHALSRPD
jgi:hypothetical protein